MSDELEAKLRAANEWDVTLATETVPIYLDAHPVALLELFNCLLDILGSMRCHGHRAGFAEPADAAH